MRGQPRLEVIAIVCSVAIVLFLIIVLQRIVLEGVVRVLFFVVVSEARQARGGIRSLAAVGKGRDAGGDAFGHGPREDLDFGRQLLARLHDCMGTGRLLCARRL